MNDSFFPQIFSLAALAVLWLANLLFLLTLNREWWKMRWVRHLIWIVPVIGAIGIGVWALGASNGSRGMISFGATLASIVLALSLAVLVALPLSGLALTTVRLAGWLSTKMRSRDVVESAPPRFEPAPVDTAPVVTAPLPAVSLRAASLRKRVDRGRRSFMTKAAAAVPAVTLSASGAGLFRSAGPVVMPHVPMTFDALHPDLEGLRILHLSDIHLGYYVDLDDLEELMRRAAEEVRPDMILVSGDIADDLSMLPGALRIIDAARPRYGTYATLGNHEYFRGVENVVRAMEAGPIPLLRSSGTTVKIGGAELHVGGADDPVSMGRRQQNHRFLQSTVERAFDGAPSEAFHLLMSHRPEGLDVAAEQGIPMTVAGHTHGAQIGFNGRSFLEPWMRERYLWGHYRKGSSQLYTSAGVGHWFPFRLGCPPEAPVYELRGLVVSS